MNSALSFPSPCPLPPLFSPRGGWAQPRRRPGDGRQIFRGLTRVGRGLASFLYFLFILLHFIIQIVFFLFLAKVAHRRS